LPESRHRKTNKARKRSRGSYPATSPGKPTGKNRNLRYILIAIVVVATVAAVVYIFKYRGPAEVRTASGLRYIDLVEGNGPNPEPGQTVSVNYVGTLQNGTKFDSSYDRGKPMEYKLGVQPMIKGWDEGVKTMKVGGKRKLIVPPSLAYGPSGRPPSIPPNSTLIFEIELLSAK
jgi:FKBP-type peptidyl-prolyl isomerase-like protein